MKNIDPKDLPKLKEIKSKIGPHLKKTDYSEKYAMGGCLLPVGVVCLLISAFANSNFLAIGGWLAILIALIMVILMKVSVQGQDNAVKKYLDNEREQVENNITLLVKYYDSDNCYEALCAKRERIEEEISKMSLTDINNALNAATVNLSKPTKPRTGDPYLVGGAVSGLAGGVAGAAAAINTAANNAKAEAKYQEQMRKHDAYRNSLEFASGQIQLEKLNQRTENKKELDALYIKIGDSLVADERV
ncbi:MAG: hypothetical protein Q4C53_07990 [Clostridia bacterium]|nr:hypothetical protein [Clostridia bacterium]